MQHQAYIDRISEGFRFVDNGQGLYRRVMSEDGRTLAYLYPRGRSYYDRKVRVVWASPIVNAPAELRDPFSFTQDANDRENFLSYLTYPAERIDQIRALILWAAANPVDRARANRPRGPRVNLTGPDGLPRVRAAVARTVTPIAERRIGIEVEFFGVARRDAERIVRETIPHASLSGWRIRGDGSVARWQGMPGLELVSPPLGGPIHDPDINVSIAQGWTDLKAVLRALRAAGARVDRTCGVHVHMEVADIGMAGVKRFVSLWAANQDTIDYLLPESRRNQDRGYVKRMNDHKVASVLRSRTFGRDDRYWVVNPCAFPKFGTVEVRQLAGTLQFSKIYHWTQFVLGLLDVAAKAPMKGARKDAALAKRPGLIVLLNDAGIDSDTCEFLEDRAVDFGARHSQLYNAAAVAA